MKTAFVIFFLLIFSAPAAAQEQPPLQGTPGSPVQIQSGSRPVPDPTALTEAAIRELREELTKWIDLQFGNLQKQVDRLILRQDAIPESIKDAIASLEKLVDEKFKGLVDQQIQRDNNLALALTAAQKSVTDTNLSNSVAAEKAERNFKDQIAAVQANITDVKDRITRIESSSSGAGGAVNWVIAAIGAAATLFGLGAGLFAMLRPAPVPVPLPVVQYAEQPRRRV